MAITKKNKIDLSKIDTVILVGGLGTRLRPVLKDKPKCLAPINGIPFIDILLNDCINQGLQRFVVSVGYLKEQIIQHLMHRNDCEIVFSEENQPLGTGGALKIARPHIKSNPFLVINGDSYININLQTLIEKQGGNLAAILVSPQNNISTFGIVKTDKDGFLKSFSEKSKANKNSLINTGRYVFLKNIFDYLPDKNSFSLEYDIFPKLIKRQRIISLIVNAELIDIGTPNRLTYAKQYFKQ
jgi:NDP-sugar pyrophosphorylase family protein